MSIRFNLRDFGHPLRIFRLRRFLERSQWLPEEELARYQAQRLRAILVHAYREVPYYRRLFDRLDLRPEEIAGPADLARLPVLTKADLRAHGPDLAAAGSRRFRPVAHATSGTTGEPVTILLDMHANVLEFCYYWRYWSWAGYRLGRPFAELGVQAFLDTDLEAPTRYTAWTRKLDLNAARLSRANAIRYAHAMRARRTAFLKGPPSGLHALARLLADAGVDLRLEAVFTTGETLLPHQRRAIEAVFQCRILDSYGHMERTVGISQCPEGGYHVHSEYGLLQIEPVAGLADASRTIGAIVGTSLHNLAMPLIRYRTGDLVEVRPDRGRCRCGRSLPLCERVLGRTQDVLVTRDGHYVTNAFVALDAIRGVAWFRIIQHDLDRFEVQVQAEAAFTAAEEGRLRARLVGLVGPARIAVTRVTERDRAGEAGGKHRGVVSHVARERIG